MDHSKKTGKKTLTIHSGVHPERWQGAVSPPVYQTSTFAFDSTAQGAARFAGEEAGFIYTRLGNPTVAALEEAVADLEEGAGAVGTASGMAAVSSVFFALLTPGDRAVASSAVYGPSRILLEKEFKRFGVETEFVRTAADDELRRAITPGTRLVYVETPANPTLDVTDIRLAADLAHEAGALLVVDNTFLSPWLQNPLRLGADVVVHSMTKSMNGHADVVAGAIAAREEELIGRLAWVVRNLGCTIDPHQAWLVHRGLKTLGLRVEAAQANAARIAEFLTGHDQVLNVWFPGLPDHPGHRLLGTQMKGPGAVVAFEVKGGVEGGRRLLDRVTVMTLAVSLGGIETLIQHPASMTHAGVSRDARIKAGITDGLIRLAVGCEDFEDLVADLDHALSLSKAAGFRRGPE